MTDGEPGRQALQRKFRRPSDYLDAHFVILFGPHEGRTGCISGGFYQASKQEQKGTTALKAARAIAGFWTFGSILWILTLAGRFVIQLSKAPPGVDRADTFVVFLLWGFGPLLVTGLPLVLIAYDRWQNR
jgi:hypothetical protein